MCVHTTVSNLGACFLCCCNCAACFCFLQLALRAGNEKEDGETADTVGCCSLRVEHLTLHEELDGNQFVVDFDFLGKDCIRYQNSVAVEKRVFKNLQLFIENKSPDDDLFDRLNVCMSPITLTACFVYCRFCDAC